MVSLTQVVRERLSITRQPPPPLIGAEDCRWSVISSAADLSYGAPAALVDTMLRAASWANGNRLPELEARCGATDRRWVETWPGEHYRFLAGLVATMRPTVVVEIGTFQGHGSLALRAGSPETRVVTYDIIPWEDIDGSVLRRNDFGPRLEQRIGDVADAATLARESETLREADLLFVDGPKDGAWEYRFVDSVLPLLTERPRLVVFDDIRLMEMVQLWRDLPYPKVDATSLGHWSGTGLMWTVHPLG